jgi:TonB family protein
MKRLIICIVIILACFSDVLKAQDTTFFNKNWQIVLSKQEAAYFRLVKKEGELWQINNYYLNGSLQMSGYFSSLDKETKVGVFKYYRPNGKIHHEQLHREDKVYQIQKWDDFGKACLNLGSGQYKYTNPNNGNLELEAFKDSSLIYAYYVEKNTSDTIYRFVSKPAEPEGGFNGYYQFIGQNLVYPKQARRMGIEGKVFISFVIRKDGTVGKFVVLKGIGAGCDEEALRVLQLYKWIPAEVNGKKVNQVLSIPISFKLD